MAVTLESFVGVAAALGRGSSRDGVVAWKGKTVYALSFDRVILLKSDVTADCPDPAGVSFQAGSFEGSEVRNENGNVVFRGEREGNAFEVSMASPVETFDVLDERFKALRTLVKDDLFTVIFNRALLSFLDPDLPHVELFVRDGELTMSQRDPYSGRTATIKRKAGVGSLEPIAARTGDLILLSRIGKTLIMKAGDGFFYLTDMSGVEAIVGGAVYDGIGTITVLGG